MTHSVDSVKYTALLLREHRWFALFVFECRYRYAPATGTNNSFWIMTRSRPVQWFEIAINEGHFPNEVNGMRVPHLRARVEQGGADVPV